VISLDTNFLIRALIPGSSEAPRVKSWLKQGETLFVSSVAWYEFGCGPVGPREIELGNALLTGGIIAFEEAQAAEAARLFNAVGRVRRLRVDAMIAATAIVANARFATCNKPDFQPFTAHGLQLI